VTLVTRNRHIRCARISVVFAALPLLLQTNFAAAQSTKERLTALESQLVRMERMLENSQAVQTEMLGRIQALQSENQQLRDELETLQFESNRSGERDRQLYMDLDERLQSLEAGRSASAAQGGSAITLMGGAGSIKNDPRVTDEQAYQAAFNELRQGRYAVAGNGFAQFLADYPSSELRDNAQYWLAETDYVTKQFEKALVGFQKVVTEYPASRKLPDAWLKIGYCNYELENWADARSALVTVSSQYPDTTAGRLAKERLTLMDQNGV
jgi:tol-pal system protein YbgF